MVYSLQYFDEVETDVREAKTYYKEQKNGLEIEFEERRQRRREFKNNHYSTFENSK